MTKHIHTTCTLSNIALRTWLPPKYFSSHILCRTIHKEWPTSWFQTELAVRPSSWASPTLAGFTQLDHTGRCQASQAENAEMLFIVATHSSSMYFCCSFFHSSVGLS